MDILVAASAVQWMCQAAQCSGGAARNRIETVRGMRDRLYDNIQIVRPIEPQVLTDTLRNIETTHGFNDQMVAMFGKNPPALDAVAVKLFVNAMLHGNDAANLLSALGLHGRDTIVTNGFGDRSVRTVEWRDVQVALRDFVAARDPKLPAKRAAVHDFIEGYLGRPEVQNDPALRDGLRHLRSTNEARRRAGR